MSLVQNVDALQETFHIPHTSMCAASFEEYSHFGKTPEYLTFSDKIQEWNKPRKRKLDSLPVISLSFRKKILEKENCLSYVAFDPQPPEHHELHNDAIEGIHVVTSWYIMKYLHFWNYWFHWWTKLIKITHIPRHCQPQAVK